MSMKLNRTKLRYISGGLLILAVLEIFQDRLGLKIDTTTILIIGIAILLYILPEISNLSKVTYGDLIFEFEREINALEKLIIVEETMGGTQREYKEANVGWQHYYNEYREILKSQSSNIDKILRA